MNAREYQSASQKGKARETGSTDEQNTNKNTMKWPQWLFFLNEDNFKPSIKHSNSLSVYYRFINCRKSVYRSIIISYNQMDYWSECCIIQPIISYINCILCEIHIVCQIDKKYQINMKHNP